jgi:hypothetical protein
MTNIKITVVQPNIGLNAGTAIMDGFEKGYAPPVIIVRVARNGEDVTGEIGGVVGQRISGLIPVGPEILLLSKLDNSGEKANDR